MAHMVFHVSLRSNRARHALLILRFMPETVNPLHPVLSFLLLVVSDDFYHKHHVSEVTLRLESTIQLCGKQKRISIMKP